MKRLFFFFLLCLALIFLTKISPADTQIEELLKRKAADMSAASFAEEPLYKECVRFFEKVYTTMQKNYFQPVTPEDFKKFLYVFNSRIYPEFREAGRSDNFIKWRSAAHMVDALKSPDDIFSALFPPADAKRYEGEVLGKRIDLGIQGTLTEEGYVVTWVEIRSDAYEKGLREKDIIKKIENLNVIV